MFCSNCGEQASGRFCSHCGSPLARDAHGSAEAREDWSQEIVYENLIRIPEVRDRLQRHAAMAEKHLSGEEFLALADKVVPLNVSLKTIGAVAQPLWAHLGVKTGEERSETFSAPPGTLLVAALCSLARHGQALQQVQQGEDGCLLEATLPSDIWSFAGTLLVRVRRSGSGATVDGVTKIQGQMFDWGKSKRCLNTLFSDLKATPA